MDVFGVHHARDLVGLPLFEREAWTGVRIVLVIGLILVVLDLREVGVCRGGIEREGNYGVDGSGLDFAGKGPGLNANASENVSTKAR